MKKRIDVMIDLESLGGKFDGATIQIAGIPFNIHTGEVKGTSFNELISPKSAVEHGLTIESDTVKWWLSQEQSVQSRVLAKAINEGLDVTTVALRFTEWIEDLRAYYDELHFWGRPATSDFPWLMSFFKACNMEFPIKFFEMRCMSTLSDLYSFGRDVKMKDLATSPLTHDALEDCRSQIEMLVAVYEECSWTPRTQPMIPQISQVGMQ